MSGTKSLLITPQAMAEAFLEGDETEGLPDGAQGDKQGALLGGGVEQAVQAGVEKVQAVQEGGDIGLVLATALMVQVRFEMFGMAAQGRGAETMLFGQGAVRHAPDEVAVDLRELGVIADGATLIHSEDGFQFSVFSFRFSARASGRGYQGGGPRGQHG